MNTLYFITGNEGKVIELQEKLKPLKYNILQKDLGYPEIQADTLEEVATYGLNHVKASFSKPFILEDAGLFITALKGFPGVYSKFVYYTIGLDGILQLMNQHKNRHAIFRSVYGYYDGKDNVHLFSGECPGVITQEKRGSHGFGYDPIFVPNGDVRTFAELTITEKNLVSHRGRALDQLIAFLQKP